MGIGIGQAKDTSIYIYQYICRYIHSSLYRYLLALALDFRTPIEAKCSEVSLKMALSCRQTCRQFHKGANTLAHNLWLQLQHDIMMMIVMMIIIQLDETKLIMIWPRRDNDNDDAAADWNWDWDWVCDDVAALVCCIPK